MHRIIIDVDGMQDGEADEAVREIRQRCFDANTSVWAVRFPHRDLNAAEIHASEKLWRSTRRDAAGVTFSRDEAEALWQRVFNDAQAVRAITRP